MRALRLLPLLLVFPIAALVWANRHSEPLPPDARADRVIVEKSRRELLLMKGDEVLKRYRIALGRAPVGHKQQEGDRRTPEGRYTIDSRLRRSGYHRALHISYPDAKDRAQAEARGVPPGGQIMIHGMRNGLGWIGRLHASFDWTLGCIAVTNAEMDELWRAIGDGTPIDSRP